MTNVDRVEFATLYTLQHRLPGNAERLGGLLHHDIILRCFLDKLVAKIIGHATLPRRAGCDLLTGHKACVDPTVERGRRHAEEGRGLLNAQQFTCRGLRPWFEAWDLPMSPSISYEVGGEAQPPSCGPTLSVENAGDDVVRVVSRQTA